MYFEVIRVTGIYKRVDVCVPITQFPQMAISCRTTEQLSSDIKARVLGNPPQPQPDFSGFIGTDLHVFYATLSHIQISVTTTRTLQNCSITTRISLLLSLYVHSQASIPSIQAKLLITTHLFAISRILSFKNVL